MKTKAFLLTIVIMLLVAGCVNRLNQVTLTPDIALTALSYAISVEGKPYVLGGRGPDNFDCSGLIVWAYKQAKPDISFRVGNEEVPDVAMNNIWRYNTVPLLPDDMKPGDIVFITDSETKITHGGMFIEWVDDSTFRFINASSYYGTVKVDEWPIIGTVRGQWFAGAGRLQTVY